MGNRLVYLKNTKNMKTLRSFSILLTLFFVLALAVRCSDDNPAPVKLLTITGIVTYPDGGGTQVAAAGAVVTMFSTSPVVNMQTIADANGNYSFINLEAANYTLAAYYDTDNNNNAGRLTGLRFSIANTDVVLGTTDATQNLELGSGGQASTPAIVANYAWDGAAYSQPAVPAWQFDNNHSLVTFQFPYRGAQAEFLGSFKQIHKFVVNFDPANLAGSSIDAEVDMSSVDTRTPGGRDNRTTVADNPVFSPATMFTELGCISGTFGITADNATPTESVPQPITLSANRYAKFSSTNIIAYGDGYLAKGNLIFNGFTVPIELWFKAMTPLVSGTTTRTGFEGRFLMNAKDNFGIDNSSVGGGDLTINISVVGSVTQ